MISRSITPFHARVLVRMRYRSRRTELLHKATTPTNLGLIVWLPSGCQWYGILELQSSRYRMAICMAIMMVRIAAARKRAILSCRRALKTVGFSAFHITSRTRTLHAGKTFRSSSAAGDHMERLPWSWQMVKNDRQL